ncbi:hypothetical protein ACHAPA_010836 [Fusarium lateritium]
MLLSSHDQHITPNNFRSINLVSAKLDTKVIRGVQVQLANDEENLWLSVKEFGRELDLFAILSRGRIPVSQFTVTDPSVRSTLLAFWICYPRRRCAEHDDVSRRIGFQVKASRRYIGGISLDSPVVPLAQVLCTQPDEDVWGACVLTVGKVKVFSVSADSVVVVDGKFVQRRIVECVILAD